MSLHSLFANLFNQLTINIGSGTPATLTNPTLQATNNVNNYTQISIQNLSNGANASADLIAYPDNISGDLTGFVDIGITSSGFNQAAYAITSPNDAYLFGSAPSGASKKGDLIIATDATGTSNSIHFGTNGFNNTANRRMTIMGSTGYVGIGTVAPTHSLTLSSSSNGMSYYNTADQVTNYERLEMNWSGNIANIMTGINGTGSARVLRVGTASAAGATTPFRYLEHGHASSSNTFTFQAPTSQAGGTQVSVSGSMTGASGMQMGMGVSPTINQTSTSGYTALLVNPTETATGSGAKNLMDLQIGSVSKFRINNTGLVDFVGSTIISAFAVVSTHKLTISVNGTTYYLLATNV